MLVGAARKTVSRPLFCSIGARSGASSTLRSVSRTPSMPAATASARQLLKPIAQHRIHIGEQQQRNLRSVCGFRRRSRAPSQRWFRRAAPDPCRAGSPARRRWGRRTERPARSVRAAAFQRRDQLAVCVGRWIAGRDVGDQRRLALSSRCSNEPARFWSGSSSSFRFSR